MVYVYQYINGFNILSQSKINISSDKYKWFQNTKYQHHGALIQMVYASKVKHVLLHFLKFTTQLQVMLLISMLDVFKSPHSPTTRS